MADELELRGTVRGARDGRPAAGHRVEARVRRKLALGGETIEQEDAGGGVAGNDGAFAFGLAGDGDPFGSVGLLVRAPDGTVLLSQELSLDEAEKPLDLLVETPPELEIPASEDPARGRNVTLHGRVFDRNGGRVERELPVVLSGVTGEGDTAVVRPVLVTATQTGGHFSGPWPGETFDSAFGRVAGGPPLPIQLEADGRLPQRVFLEIEVRGEAGTTPSGPCSADPPRSPDPGDAALNPAAFSQDLGGGGCVDLVTPNRSIEEFSYFFVVRTTEPQVQGRTLGARKVVPKALLEKLVAASARSEVLGLSARSGATTPVPTNLALSPAVARRLVRGDRPPTLSTVARSAWLAEFDRARDLLGSAIADESGRSVLDEDRPIRWDGRPRVYQAIDLALGHVLEFREVWRADGYSLGDLVYSLPLAPGQRRQVAVVDWERRSTSARTESLEFEEEVQGFIARDRDVQEIVGSRLSEETEGGSRSTTWGVAGGIGAGFITGAFGIFGGAAGGTSGSSASAWQRSSRSFSGNALQSLRDRILQRSSSVRDERSTVVQSVVQGETQRAETEVVANYNRCHAITVEYFEVLRHFLVTHEMADVRECLFVPFPIEPFDQAKALRWREPLEDFLRDGALRPAFDALERIDDDWEGYDYPESRFSEEAPESLEGELRISFVLPRPRDAEDGKFQIDMWKPWRPFLNIDALELWTAQLNERTARERDRYYREHVAPGIALSLVQKLRFSYVSPDGGEVDVPLDPTLVSSYREGRALYVSLRPQGAIPSLPREDIARFRIRYEGDPLPEEAQVVVHSGKVRYRAPHISGVLFDSPRLLNDIGVGDPVVVATPLTQRELRDPREEDRRRAALLVEHLNRHLEYYHQAIWATLDSERRFMLLDGVLVDGLEGVSVASVVENRLIGIVGNSLVFPLAAGQSLDPRVNEPEEGEEPVDLVDLYATGTLPPTRVSVPTRGVYAEVIQGECEACEEIDDTRYWRWSTEGLLAPPAIDEVSTASRAVAETALTPTALPTPLVQIQTAPDLPAPAGLGDALGLLANPELFRDATGLAATQANALAAFEGSVAAASALGGEAAKLASQNELGRNAGRMLDRIESARKDGLLSPEKAQELSESALRGLIGDSRPEQKSPADEPAVKKAIDKAVQSKNGKVKVSALDETVEVEFEGGQPQLGHSQTPAALDVDEFVDLELKGDFTKNGGAIFPAIPIPDAAKLSEIPDIQKVRDFGLVRDNPADPTRYQVFQALHIVYPAVPGDEQKVAGTGLLPVVAIVHGHHTFKDIGKSHLPKPDQHLPSHEGYTYLQEELAKRGIVSVGVDMNIANALGLFIEARADLTLLALERLRRMHNSQTRFQGRLDFSKVGLVGHSRGGDGVIRAAIKNGAPSSDPIKILGVCALSPTDLSGLTANHTLTEAGADALLVLYGGLDGDVNGLLGARSMGGTGFRHYDRATCDKAMVFLERCTHNRFNRVWKKDESSLSAGDAAAAHPRAEHEQLAAEYIGEFFSRQLLGVTSRTDLFDGTSTNKLGAPASVQWSFGKRRRPFDTMENPAASEIGTTRHTGGTVDAFPDITVDARLLARKTFHRTGVVAIQPNLSAPVQPQYRLLIDPIFRDWTGFDRLTLRVCANYDLTSAGTISTGRVPDFDLRIVDADGKDDHRRAAKMGGALRKPVLHQLKSGENVTALHLETLFVDLRKLTGVALDKVAEVTITPPPGYPSHMFFDSIELVEV